jgi:protein gp37
MMMARRFDGMGTGYDGTTRRRSGKTDWTGVVHLHPERLDTPLSWRKPRVVFVDSMSDLYHPKVPFSFIDRVFGVMSAASDHVFQILTKRPERMVDYFSEEEEELIERWANVCPVDKRPEFPLRNVWLGTSVENDATKHRIDDLRQVKAEVRFVSFEPLIGKVENVNLEEMDWVIVGGESGHDAAPMEASWAISIRDECKRNDIPFFFKQWGGKYSKENGRELDGKIYSEMPKNTRLAEYA